MPELKHNFSAAKMNKDLDERLVPNGQYRDALNIQVATSDESNVGSAQTLLGNTVQADMATIYGSDTNITGSSAANAYYGLKKTGICVGSIAVPDRDKIYFMVSAGHITNNVLSTATNSDGKPAAEDIQKDYIMEYDTVSETLKYVFVDYYRVKTTINAGVSGATTFHVTPAASSTINKTGIRIGMHVLGGSQSYSVSDNITVTDISYDTSGGTNKWKITTSDAVTFSTNNTVYFSAPRVLNFNWNTKITGINVIDDMLFWTDNNTEPKKINITRSKAGTGGVEYLVGGGIAGIGSAATANTSTIFDGDTDYFHTRLTRENVNGYLEVVTNDDKNEAVYVEEKHITVIRKAPTQPLELEMSRTSNPRVTSAGVTNPGYGQINSMNWSTYQAGDSVTLTFNTNMDYRVDDILLFTNDLAGQMAIDFTENIHVRAIVTDSNVTSPNALDDVVTVRILSISTDTTVITSTNETWYARLENGDPLFEFKFVRFSYRYKYQDGEYSTFAPFSQVAFLPGDYEFLPKKGFNLGMRNQLRGLKLKGYVPEPRTLPDDVIEIDILYKETNKPAVYTLKTIKRSINPGNLEWPDRKLHPKARGIYEVKSDLVHAILPSNQILRPYDNVPRKALAQEVSANRIIYGNYVQNYDAKDPIIKLLLNKTTREDYYNQNMTFSSADQEKALPSVKSMRTYQVGVVFSDGYGRETPVLTGGKGGIYVPKTASTTRNRLFATLMEGTEVPVWAKYYTWYVKETSSEYYTLAMDRWYPSADGNIWLSFPSSERNKLDIETFLILKKSHGLNTPAQGGVGNKKGRYKILAISSEAPDFIKTEKKSLGTLPNNLSGGSKIGSQGIGYPFEDTNFITVQKTAFENTYGKDIVIKTPDSLFLKLTGQNQTSDEYEVTNLSFNAGYYKLQIKGKFGPDVDFTSTAGTWGTIIADLNLELIEHEVENRPEFDGRFFVKIYKDETLEKHVLNPVIDETNDFVFKSENIGYLNNNYANTANLGWNSAQNTGNSGVNHPTDPYSLTSYTWGGSSGNNRFGVSSTDIADSVDALNKSKNAENFWQGMANQKFFFIDACSAYSWTSKEDDQPGQMNSPTNMTWSNLVGSALDANAWDVRQDMAPNDDPGNTKEEKGQVSRGIWNSGEYMDISWSGMGSGHTGGSMTEHPHKLSDVPGARYQEAYEFISLLVQPGTRFRFRNDPDDQIYTVQEWVYYTQAPPGQSASVFDPNTTSATGVWGIRNHHTTGLWADRWQYAGSNMRQRWTLKVDPSIGSTGSGYDPTRGTQFVSSGANKREPLHHDCSDFDAIEILKEFTQLDPSKDTFTDNPAVWETEPKETLDLDIYYQASGLIPLSINEQTNEEYLPVADDAGVGGTTFYSTTSGGVQTLHTVTGFADETITFTPALPADGSNNYFTNGDDIVFTKRDYYTLSAKATTNVQSTGSTTTIKIHGGHDTLLNSNKTFRQFHMLDWNNCWCFFNGVESDRIRDDFNAPQMDNGVKASSTLAEPIKEERREHGLIWSGIYNSQSGVNDTNQFIQAENITKDLNPIYGSIQKLHSKDTNLTTLCEDKVLRILANKDALFNADGNANVTSTSNVLGAATPYAGDYGISTNPESFAATPYQSYFVDAMRGAVLALEPNGIRPISDIGMKDYFSDTLKKEVDTVEGVYDEKKKEYSVTIGKKYHHHQIIPTYTTVSFSESANGWTSFKSWGAEDGVSLNNNFYTFSGGEIYKHHNDISVTLQGWHTSGAANTLLNVSSVSELTAGMVVSGTGIADDTTISSISATASTITISSDKLSTFVAQDLTFTWPRNYFYNAQYDSNITLVFNDIPESVKSFNTINYEGTQAKVSTYSSTSTTDAAGNTVSSTHADHDEYFNLTAKNGWYIDNITTNKQTGEVVEFKEKEGKWFGAVCGEPTISSGSTMNVDESEFSVQGLGSADFAYYADDDAVSTGTTTGTGTPGADPVLKLYIRNNQSTSYYATSSSAWDPAAGGVSGIAPGVYWYANYSTAGATNNSQTAPAGSTVSAQTVNFTLTNIINGVYSGMNLSASNFKIGNGTSSVTNQWTNPGGGSPWNADGEVNKVVFSDNGIAGDPTNTVNVAVSLDSFTMPTVDKIIYVDIDEGATPLSLPQRDVCFRVHWPYNANQTVTVSNLSGITETSVQSGSSTTPGIHSFNGAVSGNSSTLVAKIQFAAASNYHYDVLSATLQNMIFGGLNYSNQYTTEIIPTYTSNVLTSFILKVYYTPSFNPPLFPDPDNLCEYDHRVVVDFRFLSTNAAVTNTVTGISYPEEISNMARELPITVRGIAGTQYTMRVTQRPAALNAAIASSGGYYNFSTDAFQDASVVSGTLTLDSTGANTTFIKLPAVTANTWYDIVLAGVSSATIAAGAPDALAEAIIKQYGVNTLTLKPFTHNSGNYNLPSALEIKRPIPTSKGDEDMITIGKTIFAKVGNGGVSSTEVTLEKRNPDIVSGMYIIGLGAGSHKLTVTKVQDKTITMSSAQAVTDGTELRFEKDTPSIVPFEFVIKSGSGKTLTWAGQGKTQPTKAAVDGLEQVTVLIDGATSSSTTVTLDSTAGITAGMIVTAGEDGTNLTEDTTVTVVSVDSTTAITISQSSSLVNDKKLLFSNGTKPSDIGVSNVEVLDIQANEPSSNAATRKSTFVAQNVEGGDVVVEGLLKVRQLNGSHEVTIQLDDFINVS